MKASKRILFFVPLISLCLFTARARALTEEQILGGADQRIQKHRMADATLLVNDRSGRPIPDATLTIHQQNHDFLFGCNIFRLFRIPDPDLAKAYQDRFKALLNYATLPFYWRTFEPTWGEEDFDRLDLMATWCEENGILTKGHPLVWHNTVPAWVPDDPDRARTLLKCRVQDIVEHYNDLIGIWDVVNEATVSRRIGNGVGLWFKKVGAPTAVGEALAWAHLKDPAGLFIVNDFNVGPDFEKLIADLIEKKSPIKAIGIQSHMHAGPWPLTRVWQVCETYSKIRLPIHFTEVTVLSGEKRPPGETRSRRPIWPSTPDGEKAQADYVSKFYTILFSHPAVEAITWWDFSDNGAWQRAPAGLVRRDMSPKPAYNRLMSLVKGKWWTTAKTTTDSSGKATFRGFFGQYRITITTPDGQEHTDLVHLSKGADNLFTVTLK